jgi:hypothetical protein
LVLTSLRASAQGRGLSAGGAGRNRTTATSGKFCIVVEFIDIIMNKCHDGEKSRSFPAFFPLGGEIIANEKTNSGILLILLV